MKVLISGATGFVGSALVRAFERYDLVLLGRSLNNLKQSYGNQYTAVTWPSLTDNQIAECDVIINLAGANIAEGRWSSKRQAEIIQSRVSTTEQLVLACVRLGDQAPRIINASAIGVYGIAGSLDKQQSMRFDESSLIPELPTDFISKVGIEWEGALSPAIQAGLSVVMCRFGVVLDRSGGMLKKLLPSFKMGLGTVLATGQQPLSWVSLDDVVRAIEFIIEHPDCSGPVNVVSPGVVSQRDFAQALSRSLSRPRILTLPECVVKALFGQMGGELLLSGQHVVSQRLQDEGFVFNDPDLAGFLSRPSNQ